MDNGKWLQTNLDHLRDKLFLCVVKPEGTKPKHPHVILILKNRKKPKITISLAMRIDHFTVVDLWFDCDLVLIPTSFAFFMEIVLEKY